MKIKKLAILSLGAIGFLSLASCDKGNITSITETPNVSTTEVPSSTTTPINTTTGTQNSTTPTTTDVVVPTTTTSNNSVTPTTTTDIVTPTTTTTTTNVTEDWKVITAEEYLEAYNKKETPNYNWCEVSLDNEKKCYLKYDNNEWYHSPYYTDTIDINSNAFTWKKLEKSHGEYYLQVFSNEGLSQFSGGASIIVGSYTIAQVNFIADYAQTDGSYNYNGYQMLFEKLNNSYKTTATTNNGQEIYNNEYFYVTKAIWSGEASHEANFTWGTVDLSTINEKTKYTYTFYDEDGLTTLKDSTTVYEGEQIVAPEKPSKASDSDYTYRFDGWYTEKTGGTKVTTFPTISSNVSYYARYTKTQKDKDSILKHYIFQLYGMYLPCYITIKDNLIDSFGGLMYGIGNYKIIYDSDKNIVKYIDCGPTSLAHLNIDFKQNYISVSKTENGYKLSKGDCELEIKSDGTITKSDSVYENDEFMMDSYYISFEDNRVTYRFYNDSKSYLYITEVNGFCFSEEQYINDVLVRTRDLYNDGDKYINETKEYTDGAVTRTYYSEYTLDENNNISKGDEYENGILEKTCTISISNVENKKITTITYYDTDSNVKSTYRSEDTYDENYNVTNCIATSESSTGKNITTTNYTYNESNAIVSGDRTVVEKDLDDNVISTTEYVYNPSTHQFELKQ